MLPAEGIEVIADIMLIANEPPQVAEPADDEPDDSVSVTENYMSHARAVQQLPFPGYRRVSYILS